jgi:hypothetical protein
MAILIAALVVPFGLIGVASAIAASGVGVAIYAVYGIHRVARVPLSRLFAEILPAALSALVAGAALFCLEHLLVHAAQRGTAAGIALLAGEAAAGALAYLACLVALSAGVRADLTAALARLLPANRPQVAQRLLEHGRGAL